VTTPCVCVLGTRPLPGALAVITLVGDVASPLAALTGVHDWRNGVIRYVAFDDIDRGLACQIRPDLAQLTPHGGPRIVQRLITRLSELGVTLVDSSELPPRTLFPEARNDCEALMLLALPTAASPLAIDLLLAQPERWRPRPELTPEDHARSKRLNHLLHPPLVVLAGAANIGKSTLSNALSGRRVSITVDEPGVTRDYTCTLIDCAGLVVRWIDTPGLRATDNPLERLAIKRAAMLMNEADLLIAGADASAAWPDLPCSPDLRIGLRSDLGRRDDVALHAGGEPETGLEELVSAVRTALVPDEDLSHPRPWIFDARLLADYPE
jgi:hypothetical protein